MNPLQISILTYKSSILILSLIEGRTHSDNLYQQIRFSLKIDLIRKVYFKIYFQYQETLINTSEFNNNLLRMKDLNKSDEIEKKIRICKRKCARFFDFIIKMQKRRNNTK